MAHVLSFSVWGAGWAVCRLMGPGDREREQAKGAFSLAAFDSGRHELPYDFPA